MLVDQATSLRKLKEQIDNERFTQIKSPEDFLKTIVRPSPFTAIALIIPDDFFSLFPPAKNWLRSLVQFPNSTCLWDQANIYEKNITQIIETKSHLKDIVNIAQINQNINTLPRRNDIDNLKFMSIVEKYKFIDSITKGLKNYKEVWISIKSSELFTNLPIIHATDAACIMIPEHTGATLKCYEIVKNLHLSGYFSPITTLSFINEQYIESNSLSKKIKKVAKQFLGLDLLSAGVVLSDCTHILPEGNNNFHSQLNKIIMNSKDFLYTMAESLVYNL